MLKLCVFSCIKIKWKRFIFNFGFLFFDRVIGSNIELRNGGIFLFLRSFLRVFSCLDNRVKLFSIDGLKFIKVR